MLKTRLMAAAALAAVLPAVPAVAQAPGQASAVYDLSCDRECLIAAVNSYVDALRARDPSAAPVAENAVFTENNVILQVGEGLWKTVTDVDQVGLEAADPITGNAAWFGSVRENGEPAIFAVRIHVKDGKIDEIETVVHRKTALPAPFGDVENMTHDPAFNEVLPPEQRRQRPRLRAIADSYFDTVELNDGQVLAPFDEDCGRLENGISTTSRAADGVEGFTLVDGCEAQFELGIYRINKRIRERLYPIIDTERGVVVASGFFDHANEFDRYNLTDGREMMTALKWPNSITLLEAFRIKDAKIHRIEAVFTYVPYFMHNPFAGPASSPPEHKVNPATCDAACLTGLASSAMAALPTGDWQSLNWADAVSYSENSVGLQVGEGIWGSTRAVDSNPLIVADASTGKAVWIGRIEAHGQPAWAAVTVAGTDGEIAGMEAVIRRKEYGPPYVEPVSGPSFAAIPQNARSSRSDLIAAAENFYDALEKKDGTVPAAFGENCNFVINGQELGACAAPFSAKRLQTMERVRDRSVLAVDEARGLVVFSTFEDFPGTDTEYTDAAGETYKDTVPYPRTMQVVELFRVEGRKIAQVMAFTSELPYGMKPHR